MKRTAYEALASLVSISNPAVFNPRRMTAAAMIKIPINLKGMESSVLYPAAFMAAFIWENHIIYHRILLQQIDRCNGL